MTEADWQSVWALVGVVLGACIVWAAMFIRWWWEDHRR